MTKEERKAKRQKNKEARKARKSLRAQQFDTLLSEIQKAPELPADGAMPEYQVAFEKYWPVVKAALTYVESAKITGAKMDGKIRDIITLGDSVDGGTDPSAFREKLLDVWKVIRVILISVTVFNKNDADDEKIDKILEIGDFISGRQ